MLSTYVETTEGYIDVNDKEMRFLHMTNRNVQVRPTELWSPTHVQTGYFNTKFNIQQNLA